MSVQLSLASRMGDWLRGPTFAIGGIVAVAFDGEAAIAVGSHSGLGVFDARTGELLERVPDTEGDYGWHQADPPSIRREGSQGVRLLPSAGLWGDRLDHETQDGWAATAANEGVVVAAAGHVGFSVDDSDEPRAFGFSPGGTLFVLATSARLYAYVR
ncbi:hypothetical protein GCM10027053_47690 [Intrasporangium mesophilum]